MAWSESEEGEKTREVIKGDKINTEGRPEMQ